MKGQDRVNNHSSIVLLHVYKYNIALIKYLQWRDRERALS